MKIHKQKMPILLSDVFCFLLICEAIKVYFSRLVCLVREYISWVVTKWHLPWWRWGYVIISRNEYNSVTKQFLACKTVYSKNVKPYLAPIKVSGLRRNSKVNTLNIHTLKQRSNSDLTHEFIGEITNKEFLKIAQAVSLKINFPL